MLFSGGDFRLFFIVKNIVQISWRPPPNTRNSTGLKLTSLNFRAFEHPAGLKFPKSSLKATLPWLTPPFRWAAYSTAGVSTPTLDVAHVGHPAPEPSTPLKLLPRQAAKNSGGTRARPGWPTTGAGQGGARGCGQASLLEQARGGMPACIMWSRPGGACLHASCGAHMPT